MVMTSYIFVVHSEPMAGREDEFNHWYENVHLDDVVAVPGFIAAQRFKIDGEPFQGPRPPHRYLCIYEMETDDPDATMRTLAEAADNMFVSPALDRDGSIGITYRMIGPRHSRA
jgi:hypothetical protein